MAKRNLKFEEVLAMKGLLADLCLRYEDSVSVALCRRPQGVIVYLNPPTFFWPPSGRPDARYTIQYSKTRGFDDCSTVTVEDLDLTFYRPSRFLSEGKWCWRYKADDAAFSDAYEFYVGGETVKDDVITTFSSFEEAISRVPKAHPRIWVLEEDLERIRRENVKKPRSREILKVWESSTKKYIGAELRDDVPREHKISETEDVNYQVQTWRRWDSKSLAASTMVPAGSLSALYLVTGSEVYAEEAKRRALHAASWNPDGFTSHHVSDFANQMIAENLAIVYDYLYDHLAKDERSKIRDAIAARAGRIYDIYRRKYVVPDRVFDEHAWQHILQGLGICSLALLHEVADAAEWFEYFLKLYVWVYPPWGDIDGGWSSGNSYFEDSVMLSALTTADLIRKATGIDLYKKPWYQNMPYYLIYTHPPRTFHPHFGDGEPRFPTRRNSVVLRRLAREVKNPYAVWYAEEVEKDNREPLSARFEYFWSLEDDYQCEPPADRPLSRCFRGIGWVLMHTNLVNPEDDVVFAFKCSPYGSRGHSHADQNTFSMVAYGKTLVADSGYYVTAGDKHSRGWYKQTPAHNTIMVDGLGQEPGVERALHGRGPTGSFEGYGSIEKFLFSQDYDYAVGDASNAYVDEAGLKKFKRHVLFLRPDIYAIFDELEADHQASWEWLLHSNNKMRIEEENSEVWLSEETADLKVNINSWNSESLKFNLTDQFDVPPINWHGRWYRGKMPPNQWHLRVSPKDKRKVEFFLAVLQPRKRGETRSLPEVEWIKTDGLFGFTTQRGDRRETVIFSPAGQGIKLGDVETDASMLALSLENGDLKSFVISDATQMRYRGKKVFSSHKPTCANVSFKVPRGWEALRGYDSRNEALNSLVPQNI